MMHLSAERTLMVCYLFLKRVRNRYGRKPILADGALWCVEACRWLRLEYSVYPVEEKNLMERFIQNFKERTGCFDDSFPCMKEGCNRYHVWNWLKMFILRIHLRMDIYSMVSVFVRGVS